MPKTLRGSFDQALRPLPSVVKASNAKEEGVGGTRVLAHSIVEQCIGPVAQQFPAYRGKTEV